MTIDFETIPDTSLAEYLTGYEGYDRPSAPSRIDNPKSEFDERVEAINQYMLDKTGKEDQMPPPGLNQIVTGGLHLAFIQNTTNIGEWYETRHLSSIAAHEKEIVTSYVEYLGKTRPRIVSFNGRAFDIPLLMLRAAKWGVSMAFWFQTSDRWNNYMSRYAPEYHFDVADFITLFGASSRMKLRELMAILRLPDKVYRNGGEVLGLYKLQQFDHIREYCELDCLNTFLCYVYIQHLRGVITDAGRDMSIRSVIGFLKSHSDMPYLKLFLDEWCTLDNFVRAECK